MYLASFCLSLILTLVQGSRNDELFISHILDSWDGGSCILGHVSDGDRPTISNELIAELHER